jgi:biopolymer transport protein ExbB
MSEFENDTAIGMDPSWQCRKDAGTGAGPRLGRCGASAAMARKRRPVTNSAPMGRRRLAAAGALLLLGVSISAQAISAQAAPPPDAGSVSAAPAASGETSPAVPPAAAAAVAPMAAPAGTAPAPAVSASLLPQDLSVSAMFLHADIIVRIVMIGLLGASVVTWTMLLGKGLELIQAKRNIRRELVQAEAHETLAELVLRTGGVRTSTATMAAAAAREMTLSGDTSREGVKERIASRLHRIESQLGRRMNHGTGWLATIGATAPFVGLFGTVWGIMNSFIGISRSQTTNLAVVAPGIAEALLATAAGLVAAIPAVVIYNLFSRGIGGYRASVADLAATVERLASRDVDAHRTPLKAAAE